MPRASYEIDHVGEDRVVYKAKIIKGSGGTPAIRVPASLGHHFRHGQWVKVTLEKGSEKLKGG